MSDPSGVEPPHYAVTTYLWALWLSWWGAAAAYLQRIKHVGSSAFSPFAFMSETIISGLTGIIILYLGDWQRMDPRLMGASIAISGHFATRAIFLLRNALLGVK